MTPCRRLWRQVVGEHAGLDAECAGDPHQRLERRCRVAAFAVADVGRVQPGGVGECFLGDALVEPDGAEPVAERFGEGCVAGSAGGHDRQPQVIDNLCSIDN